MKVNGEKIVCLYKKNKLELIKFYFYGIHTSTKTLNSIIN